MSIATATPAQTQAARDALGRLLPRLQEFTQASLRVQQLDADAVELIDTLITDAQAALDAIAPAALG